MSSPRVLAMVMAGGEGKRLYPLTAQRSKPAVPFGGRYRIVDFVLSNFVNSGIYSIYLLVQYKSQSLIEHIRKTWVMSQITAREFVTVVPPQMLAGQDWFKGNADAVFQNLNLIDRFAPDVVAVFGADHVYRMDISQMIDFHCARKADVTVAALPAPLEACRQFGVLVTDPAGRITEFQEKPDKPIPIPGDPEHGYASMGNYLFSTDVLVEALEAANRRGGNDFGRHILPRIAKSHSVFAYDFAENRVPGTKPYEDRTYWRDVGTIDTYYEAHRDMLGIEPRFDDFNIEWPIYSSKHLAPVAKIIGGEIVNSVFGGGSLVNEAAVRNSVIRREVVVEKNVEIEDCVVMDYTMIGEGSRLRGAIVDRYNMIEPGTVIGYDRDEDRRRFHVSPGGVVVVPAGSRGLKYVY
jgi:glucose-1-phosphate adenylyltransferase